MGRIRVANDHIALPEKAERQPVAIPEGAWPRGLSRAEAAAYIGVSPTTFNRMIVDKLMPEPIRIYGRTVWDIRKLDAAFAALDTPEMPMILGAACRYERGVSHDRHQTSLCASGR